jgi:hypothetical protein
VAAAEAKNLSRDRTVAGIAGMIGRAVKIFSPAQGRAGI